MHRRLQLIGGWAGIIAPTIYVATWAVLGARRAGYDAGRQAISELGEIGAATAPAMSTGFVVFGLLSLPLAAALHVTLPGRPTVITAAAAVCGVATIGAAVFPCSPGCPGPGASATDTGHAVVAGVGYLALMGAPLLTAVHLRTAGTRWRRFAWWSAAVGGVGSLLLLLWTLGLFGPAGGAAQRTFNTLGDVWWASAGVVVLRHRLGSAVPGSPRDG